VVYYQIRVMRILSVSELVQNLKLGQRALVTQEILELRQGLKPGLPQELSQAGWSLVGWTRWPWWRLVFIDAHGNKKYRYILSVQDQWQLNILQQFVSYTL